MGEKHKVLWVTNTLSCGGAQKQLLYMYDILNKYCDYDITVLSYARVEDEISIDGVKTVYIDKESTGKCKTVLKIARFIKEHDIDIMHAFGGSMANIYGRAAAMLCPKTVSVGAMLGKKHFASRSVRIISSLLNLFGNWWTVNNLELIPILKRDLRFLSDSHIKMLHNGFAPYDEVNYQLDQWTDYDQDKNGQFVFTVVGRLEPVKNYPLFLKAASMVAQKCENVRFWVVGNGTELNYLKQLSDEYGIADKVRFWGYREDVDTALSRTDVFVQTSLTEGSPNTIAEAMRARLPVISTKSTDLSEMIVPGKNGYIVENDAVLDLAAAMENLLNMDQEQRNQFGEKSYELFEKNFLDTHVAAEFDAFYRALLQKR